MQETQILRKLPTARAQLAVNLGLGANDFGVRSQPIPIANTDSNEALMALLSAQSSLPPIEQGQIPPVIPQSMLKGLRGYKSGTAFLKAPKGVPRKGDHIPVLAEHGEAILPKKTVQKVGPQNIARLIESTSGQAPAKGLRAGGKYAQGEVPYEDRESIHDTLSGNQNTLSVASGIRNAVVPTTAVPSVNPTPAPIESKLLSYADTHKPKPAVKSVFQKYPEVSSPAEPYITTKNAPATNAAKPGFLGRVKGAADKLYTSSKNGLANVKEFLQPKPVPTPVADFITGRSADLGEGAKTLAQKAGNFNAARWASAGGIAARLVRGAPVAHLALSPVFGALHTLAQDPGEVSKFNESIGGTGESNAVNTGLRFLKNTGNSATFGLLGERDEPTYSVKATPNLTGATMEELRAMRGGQPPRSSTPLTSPGATPTQALSQPPLDARQVLNMPSGNLAANLEASGLDGGGVIQTPQGVRVLTNRGGITQTSKLYPSQQQQVRSPSLSAPETFEAPGSIINGMKGATPVPTGGGYTNNTPSYDSLMKAVGQNPTREHLAALQAQAAANMDWATLGALRGLAADNTETNKTKLAKAETATERMKMAKDYRDGLKSNWEEQLKLIMSRGKYGQLGSNGELQLSEDGRKFVGKLQATLAAREKEMRLGNKGDKGGRLHLGMLSNEDISDAITAHEADPASGFFVNGLNSLMGEVPNETTEALGDNPAVAKAWGGAILKNKDTGYRFNPASVWPWQQGNADIRRFIAAQLKESGGR